MVVSIVSPDGLELLGVSPFESRVRPPGFTHLNDGIWVKASVCSFMIYSMRPADAYMFKWHDVIIG